jgi:hypothetical protein
MFRNVSKQFDHALTLATPTGPLPRAAVAQETIDSGCYGRLWSAGRLEIDRIDGGYRNSGSGSKAGFEPFAPSALDGQALGASRDVI